MCFHLTSSEGNVDPSASVHQLLSQHLHLGAPHTSPCLMQKAALGGSRAEPGRGAVQLGRCLCFRPHSWREGFFFFLRFYLLCPDWESNWLPFGSQATAQSTEPHQPGRMMWVLSVVICDGSGSLQESGAQVWKPKLRGTRHEFLILSLPGFHSTRLFPHLCLEGGMWRQWGRSLDGLL